MTLHPVYTRHYQDVDSRPIPLPTTGYLRPNFEGVSKLINTQYFHLYVDLHNCAYVVGARIQLKLQNSGSQRLEVENLVPSGLPSI